MTNWIYIRVPGRRRTHQWLDRSDMIAQWMVSTGVSKKPRQQLILLELRTTIGDWAVVMISPSSLANVRTNLHQRSLLASKTELKQGDAARIGRKAW